MNVNTKAPVFLSKTLEIKAGPKKIWRTLSDFENWDSWNDRVKVIKMRGELTVGTTFTWKSGGARITSQIHTLTEHRVLGWTGKTLGARAIHNWYLQPTKKGTLVRVEESMEGWLVSLMKNKMMKIVSDDMNYWLKQLCIESKTKIL